MSNLSIDDIDDMMNDFSSGVYNFTKNGECIECGACCSRHLALSNKEINTIRNYIQKHDIKQQKHALFVYKDPMFDSMCPFLDDTKPNHKCLIYEVRPLLCREFKCDCWQNISQTSKIYKANLHPVDMVELFFGNKG